MSQYTVNIVTTADLAALNNLTIATQKQYETAERLKRQYEDAIKQQQAGSAAYNNTVQAIGTLDRALQSQSAQLVFQQTQLRASATMLNSLGTAAGRAAAAAQQAAAANIGQQLGQQAGPIAKVTEALGQFRAAYNGAGQGINGVVAALDAGLGSWLAWGYAAKQATDLVRSSVGEFAQAESAIVKMESALARNGQLTGEMSKRYQDLASALQDATGIADERWIGVLAKLTTRGADPEKIEQYGDAVKNLAAVMGGNVERAAFVFERAMDGQFGALRRFGIEVDKNASQQEKMASAMAQLAKKGGGDFEAQMRTVSGRTAELRNKLSDLKELIGEEFAPGYKFFLAGAANLAGAAIEAIKKVKEEMAGLSVVSDLIKKAFPGLAEAFGTVTQKNNEMAASASRAKELEAAHAEEMKNSKKAAEEAADATKKYVSELKEQADAQLELLDAETKLKLAQVDADEKTGRVDKVEASRRRLNIRTESENRKFAIEQEKARADIQEAAQDYNEKTEAYNRQAGGRQRATARNEAAKAIAAQLGRVDQNSPAARARAAEIAQQFGVELTEDLLGPKGVANTAQELQVAERGDEDGELTKKREKEMQAAAAKLRALQTKFTTRQQSRAMDVQRENLTNAVTFGQQVAEGTFERKIGQREASNAEIVNRLGYDRSMSAPQRRELESQRTKNELELQLLKLAQSLQKALASGNPEQAQALKNQIAAAVNDANRNAQQQNLTVGGQRVVFNIGDFQPSASAVYGGRGLTPAAVGIASPNARPIAAPQFAAPTSSGITPLGSAVPVATASSVALPPAYTGFRAQIGTGAPLAVPGVSPGGVAAPGFPVAALGPANGIMASGQGPVPVVIVGVQSGVTVPVGPGGQSSGVTVGNITPSTGNITPSTGTGPASTPATPTSSPGSSGAPSGNSVYGLDAIEVSGRSSVAAGVAFEASAAAQANRSMAAIKYHQDALNAAKAMKDGPLKIAALTRANRGLAAAQALASKVPTSGLSGILDAGRSAFSAIPGAGAVGQAASGISAGLAKAMPKFAGLLPKATAAGKLVAAPLQLGISGYEMLSEGLKGFGDGADQRIGASEDEAIADFNAGGLRGALTVASARNIVRTPRGLIGAVVDYNAADDESRDLNKRRETMTRLLGLRGEDAKAASQEAAQYGLAYDPEKGRLVSGRSAQRRGSERVSAERQEAAARAADSAAQSARVAKQVSEEEAAIPKSKAQAAEMVRRNTAKAMVGVRASQDRSKLQASFDRQLDENEAQINAAKAQGLDTSALERKRSELGMKRQALDDERMSPQQAINKAQQVAFWKQRLEKQDAKIVSAGGQSPEEDEKLAAERAMIAGQLQNAQRIGEPATAVATATPVTQTATGVAPGQALGTPVQTATTGGVDAVQTATANVTQSGGQLSAAIAQFGNGVVATNQQAVAVLRDLQVVMAGFKRELDAVQEYVKNHR